VPPGTSLAAAQGKGAFVVVIVAVQGQANVVGVHDRAKCTLEFLGAAMEASGGPGRPMMDDDARRPKRGKGKIGPKRLGHGAKDVVYALGRIVDDREVDRTVVEARSSPTQVHLRGRRVGPEDRRRQAGAVTP
jgi:hypothetical protein